MALDFIERLPATDQEARIERVKARLRERRRGEIAGHAEPTAPAG